MRVFAISDVHTDFRENMQRVAALSAQAYRDDALILAGDVSHDLTLLRKTLALFLHRFRHVFFVPGNHELWIRQGEHEHSVQKFYDILRLCESLGVHTSPQCIGREPQRVCVVPLFSWYTRPEEGTDSLFRDRVVAESAVSLWTDDYLVKWPTPVKGPGGAGGFSPTRFFLDMNAARVSAAHDADIVSFSHFLPRAELMFASPGEPTRPPPDRHEKQFNFSRVAGSTLIEEQIRRLGSQVHVYGHQHRNRCRYYEGIWYVSNCLGYREEQERRGLQGAAAPLIRVWPAPPQD
ncbi:MAG: metallophosphoesterase family protein [Gammaproteobacteria bacterium]